MAYNGYLMKVGVGNPNPFIVTGEKYINYKTYSVTREVQDMNSYRDGTGKLHRNALKHVPIKVTFEIREGLNNTELGEFFGGFSRNYITPIERKSMIEVYVPETDEYVIQEMYMAGPSPKIKTINPKTNTLTYETLKISLIGY